MKKLIATMQKRESREEMVSKLEEILIPLASILNNDIPVYNGFPVESITLKGSDEVFIIGFNNNTLALVNLEKATFSVFGSPEYDLTAEEHAVVSHLWSELKKMEASVSDNDIDELVNHIIKSAHSNSNPNVKVIKVG